jgi:starvation-inducible outer membrane lipoprotein
MKSLLVGLMFLAGCTSAPHQTAETGPGPEPARRTYTAEQMSKTGRQTVGGQLEQVDASVRTTHGGR